MAQYAALVLGRRMLDRQTGTKQIIMITDGEPTAHITPGGDVYFNYPPVSATVEATLREVVRCTREGIRINTFMLDADSGLRSFIEKLTAINRGRAFFTPRNLATTCWSISEHKRRLSRAWIDSSRGSTTRANRRDLALRTRICIRRILA